MAHTIYQQQFKFDGSVDVRAAAIVRHFDTRQELSGGLVITYDKGLYQAIVRHWKRLIRDLQSKRDITVDADEKLRITSKIIRMQTAHPQGKIAEPNLTIIDASELSKAQLGNYKTVYLMNEASESIATLLTDRLPAGALLVGPRSPFLSGPHVDPKTTLDSYAEDTWQELVNFLTNHSIDIHSLAKPHAARSEQIDDALDQLLDDTVSQEFLRIVTTYRGQNLLAAPRPLSNVMEREHHTVTVLARQVQTFSTNLFGQQFSPSDNDPTFFLNDEPLVQLAIISQATCDQADAHERAGRARLAHALRQLIGAHPGIMRLLHPDALPSSW